MSMADPVLVAVLLLMVQFFSVNDEEEWIPPPSLAAVHEDTVQFSIVNDEEE
jgi:hypothetical protein